MNARTPSELEIPALLMNFPFTVDNNVVNNPLMKNVEEYNHDRAFKQFMGLYSAFTREGALIYLLPSEKELQDLPYVANIGCYLPHIKEPTIIVANFKSPPRKGESKVGEKFFESMTYTTHKPPTHWEGEADLKYIRDNIYIAGYGIRSDLDSYGWMSKKFGMKILPIEMSDKKLYHFDCMFFPLSDKKALVAVSVVEKDDLKRMEKLVEVVEVPKKYIYDGWTNLIRIGKKLFYNMPPTTESRHELDKLIEKLGYDPVGVNLGEFDKSGADLSCLVMHLNYKGRK